MNDFTSPEKYGRLDLVALLQESDDVILLEFVIVIIRVGSKLHFLDRDVFLVLLGLVKLLVHLVKVFAIIHDPANRGLCSWRYLDQVQAPLLGNFQCLLRGHDSELLVLVVNDADLARSDSPVDPYVFIDGLDLLKHSAWDKR